LYRPDNRSVKLARSLGCMSAQRTMANASLLSLI
jgi:hypothetical protein